MAGTLQVVDLTCEYRRNPLGLDVAAPRLGWKLQTSERAARQQAYQIQVATDSSFEQALAWDSGKVESAESFHIVYGGEALQPRTKYYYRVRAWVNKNVLSDWSAVAWWETGLMGEGWSAQWITPSPDHIDPLAAPAYMLRTVFEAKGALRSARVYATSAGLYELFVNGARISDELLAPGWTSYAHRHQYQAYDVTSAVASGANAIGIMLGDGWYKGDLVKKGNRHLYGQQRAALVQLHLLYEDGTEQVVSSDANWRASAAGPIQLSEIYHGEIYDARLEQPGWDTADYDDAGWHPAVAAELPTAQLVAQENLPIRVTERLSPVSFIRTPAGEAVLDMGQNMVGRIRLTVEAPAGTEITLHHAEVLDREGNFYTGNLRTAEQKVVYIAAGDGVEEYAPHFTFQGFRYVRVTGYPGAEHGLPLDRFVGEVMHTDMGKAGEFNCSNPLVNQLQANIVWGQRGNFVDVPTDCPQRDERLGWTGDAQVFIRTALFNYEGDAFFTKWLRDLQADQLPSGIVPFVVPDVLRDGTGSSAWGDAAVICPWEVYMAYGDRRLLEEQYASMKGWVDYIHGQGTNPYLWNTGFHFGDWLALDAKENSYFGATPNELIATAFFAHSTRLLRDAAVVLGKAEDVRRYTELLERVKGEFRREFITPSGRLASPTQTAHAVVLVFGLAEDGDEQKRIAADLNELVKKNNFHLTTGFVGTPYLCLALSQHGYHETAVKLLLQENYPSWLYSVNKGATTIWEHWDGIKQDGTFWSEDMNSYNHYAYGAIGDWLYRVVAGLGRDEAVAGYKRIAIRPHLGNGELAYAKAAHESLYGRISSAWTITEGQVMLEVEIPANTTASILLPGGKLEEASEGGQLLWKEGQAQSIAGIEAVVQTADGVLVEVGSGSYRFEFRLPANAEAVEAAGQE